MSFGRSTRLSGPAPPSVELITRVPRRRPRFRSNAMSAVSSRRAEAQAPDQIIAGFAGQIDEQAFEEPGRLGGGDPRRLPAGAQGVVAVEQDIGPAPIRAGHRIRHPALGEQRPIVASPLRALGINTRESPISHASQPPHSAARRRPRAIRWNDASGGPVTGEAARTPPIVIIALGVGEQLSRGLVPDADDGVVGLRGLASAAARGQVFAGGSTISHSSAKFNASTTAAPS